MLNYYKIQFVKFLKCKTIKGLVFCFYLLFSNYLNAQNLIPTVDSLDTSLNITPYNKNVSEIINEKKIPYPNITPYLGAGFFAGGRIGIIVKFIEYISAEISYGNDLRNFIGLSDEETRFGIGANYHLPNLPLHVNLYYIYGFRTNSNPGSDEYARYLYSINAGYMPNQKGLTPFARIGLYYETYKDILTNEVKGGSTFFNIDLGIGWTF